MPPVVAHGVGLRFRGRAYPVPESGVVTRASTGLVTSGNGPTEQHGICTSFHCKGIDASGDNVKLLCVWKDFLAGFEGFDRVRPIAEDLVQERFGLHDEVTLAVFLGHLEILGRAPDTHDVHGRELDFDAVAEFGYQLERFGSSGQLIELQNARKCIWSSRFSDELFE